MLSYREKISIIKANANDLFLNQDKQYLASLQPRHPLLGRPKVTDADILYALLALTDIETILAERSTSAVQERSNTAVVLNKAVSTVKRILSGRKKKLKK